MQSVRYLLTDVTLTTNPFWHVGSVHACVMGGFFSFQIHSRLRRFIMETAGPRSTKVFLQVRAPLCYHKIIESLKKSFTTLSNLFR